MDGAHLTDNPFRKAVLDGLAATPKAIPCRFFYDERGSRLFDAICDLPEYYVTRTETAMMERFAGEMAMELGSDAELVEFGAGSSVKIRLLLDALDRPRGFVPIDISGEHLLASVEEMRPDYPDLRITPVVGDFTQPLRLPETTPGARRVGFFPGSTIGNFGPDQAVAFLSGARQTLDGGGLLIGVDLLKDPAVLEAAYDDAQGVTAAFNKNLIVRANAELGADFDPDAFAHRAVFNDPKSRVEMHLESLRPQTVTVDGHRFDFARGETIHTENSHKYSVAGFAQLAARAGFRRARTWIDDDGLFSVHWLESA